MAEDSEPFVKKQELLRGSICNEEKESEGNHNPTSFQFPVSIFYLLGIEYLSHVIFKEILRLSTDYALVGLILY